MNVRLSYAFAFAALGAWTVSAKTNYVDCAFVGCPPADYAAFPRSVERTARYACADFDVEEYRQANGPQTFQRVLMAVPRGLKGKAPCVVVPFYFPEAQQKIFRNYLKLRYSLIPYIYSSALEGAETGMPIVRAMPLEFPDDRAVDRLQSQYMFGPFLCVGTFVDKSIYLPEGVWTDAWTGQKVVSRGQTYTGEIPSDRAGYLFIRQGAIIPCLDDVKYIGCEPTRDYIVKFYPHGYSSYVMRDSDAESYGYEEGRISYTKFECEESGKKVKLTVNPVQGTFENMPSTRTYTLQVALDKKPSRVMLNGKAVRDWVWTDCGKMSLTLKDVSVSEKIEVICKL